MSGRAPRGANKDGGGGGDALVARIAELQKVRDELVEANDALIAAVADLRRLGSSTGTAAGAAHAAGGTPRAASSASAQHSASPQAASPADSGVGSRFARFVGDIVEKRNHGVDDSAARSEAADRADAAALAASQLNVRLLQQALRAQGEAAQLRPAAAGAAATSGSGGGANCTECASWKARAVAAEARAAGVENTLAAKVAQFNASLADLAAGKAEAEEAVEVLAAKCTALQEALEELMPRPAPSKPTTAVGGTSGGSDVDFDFDEFNDPAEAGPSSSDVRGSKDGDRASGKRGGDSNALAGGSASQELLQVALAEVAQHKQSAESLRRQLAEARQTAERDVAEARAAAADAAAEREAAALRETSLGKDVAAAKEALTVAEAAAAERDDERALEVAGLEQRLRQRDSALKELRATLARAEKADSPPPGQSHSVPCNRRHVDSATSSDEDDGGHGTRRHHHHHTGSTTESSTQTSHEVTLAPFAGTPRSSVSTPRYLPGSPPAAAGASTPQQRPAKPGTLGRIRGLFGGGSHGAVPPAPTPAARMAEMKSAPVQKLRALLEETLQENLRLQARVVELETVSSNEMMHL